jgi:hypothetical protein
MWFSKATAIWSLTLTQENPSGHRERVAAVAIVSLSKMMVMSSFIARREQFGQPTLQGRADRQYYAGG